MILLLACAARSLPPPPVAAPVEEPEVARVVISHSTPSILEYPQFVPGTATLVSGQEPLLAAIIEVMNDHPDVRLVEVGGHADPSEGDASVTHRLSQQRAAAVLEKLIAGGIAAERLTARGYGESQPLVPGEAPEQNARVMLSILARD